MAQKGVEIIVGVVRDPVFGPIITVGAGGVAAELLQDVARLQGPVNERQAMEMIRSLRCFRLLDGYRGAARADIDALARLVAKVSEFAAIHAAEVCEVELNPVSVHSDGKGVTVIDALIVIAPEAE
jgi:acyl-CoA synthetase (NDP forming)